MAGAGVILIIMEVTIVLLSTEDTTTHIMGTDMDITIL